MTTHLLITGFTAFDRFAVNPAETIGRQVAAAVGARFEPVEVSFAAADEIVRRVGEAATPTTRWLMLGVAGTADQVRVERLARNAVGRTADVRGVVRGPGQIDADGPATRAGTLWAESLAGAATPTAVGAAADDRRTVDRAAGNLPPGCRFSDDAGDYLCNYLYWSALTRLPAVRVGFVHVTPTEALPAERQAAAIVELLLALMQETP